MSETNESHPLDSVIATPSTSGTILQMQSGLFALGRNRALSSGATKPVPEDLRAIEDHARAMARDTYRDRFDPSQHTHDQMREKEYENHLEQRDEAQQGEAHARANLRDAEARLANTPNAGDKPVANRWSVAAFINTITITVAPTLHDFVFHTIADDLLAWFGALVSAGFVATMLTLAILNGRKTASWVGVAAGVIVGIGLGTVRLSSAEGFAEAMFAIGLTIVEIAAVVLLEYLARGLRNADQQWTTLKNVEKEAIAVRNAAEGDLSRRLSHLKEINEAIQHNIAYVEDRFNRNLHLPELEADAVKAALDGYNSGITENVGRLRGAIRRPQ